MNIRHKVISEDWMLSEKPTLIFSRENRSGYQVPLMFGICEILLASFCNVKIWGEQPSGL